MMHEPVMKTEVMELLRVREGAVCIDCTAGSGGHAQALARAAGASGRLLCIDRDEEALERVRARLVGVEAWVRIVHGNFEDVGALAEEQGIEAVDAIVMDLGVSSEQLDDVERGFSFRADRPLDMRMDRSRGVTAAEWLAGVGVEELATTLWEYGEERHARRIAKAIDRQRREVPLRTTGALANAVERVVGRRHGRIHPATKVFQAVRMAVNRELASIEAGIDGALALLKAGGRLAVIAFHSVEDRLVKRTLARHEGREESLYEGGSRWVGVAPRIRRVTRKPVTPAPHEVEANPRSRSAKLRVVERCGETERSEAA